MDNDDIPDEELRTPGEPTDRVEPYGGGSVPSGIEGPLFQKVGKRKSNGRDAKILVTAADGQTGVGKSNLCDFLGYVLDTSAEGFAPRKVTIEPIRFLELYSELEPESAIVMEEGEQFDSRRGMTNENVEATQKWQQARVREIIALVNLPDPTMIDSRFERLCDFWINVEIRGRARVYEKKINATRKKIYYKTLQTIEWPNMDGSDTFRHMDDIKGDLIDGELDNDGLIRESEAEELQERAVRNAKKEMRDEFIKCLYNIPICDLSPKEIAAMPPVDVGSSRVGQIAREDT